VRTNLSKEVQDFKCKDFWHPMLEAITNSMQSQSTNIEIIFELESQTNDGNIPKKINGFSVIDNGDGFVKRNRERFSELKSYNKTETEKKNKKGCKGLGRLSYLKIFQEIEYISKTKEETIKFTFTENFSDNDYKITKENNPKTETTAIFKNLTTKIKDNSKK
jgi:hypothetical protein